MMTSRGSRSASVPASTALRLATAAAEVVTQKQQLFVTAAATGVVSEVAGAGATSKFTEVSVPSEVFSSSDCRQFFVANSTRRRTLLPEVQERDRRAAAADVAPSTS